MQWLESFLTSDSHTSIAGRIALSSYLIRVASAGLAYLVQIFLARWLGAFDYGVYVMVWTWVLILGHIATLGLSVIPELFIPTYTQQKNFSLLRGYALYSRLATFLSAAVIAALGILGIAVFGARLENYYIWPFYLAFICLPFFTVTEMFDGMSRCYNAAFTALGPPYILRPLFIILFMAAGHALGLPATASGAMLAVLAACITAAALQSALVSRLLARHVPKVPLHFDQRAWLLAAMPLFATEASRVLLQNIDILALSHYVEPQSMAVYFAVSKTLALAIFVNFAIAAAASHRFTEYHVSGDHSRLKEFIAQTSFWSFSATVLAVIAVLVMGRGFLYLFGPGYVAGFSLLFVFSIGVVARSSVGPADRLLGLLGHQKLLAKIVAATLALTVILLALFVPHYGVFGAAGSMSASMIFETLLLAYFVHRKLGLTAGFWKYFNMPQANS
jgi:O-antigen/teichoic acid export membrane protein